MSYDLLIGKVTLFEISLHQLLTTNYSSPLQKMALRAALKRAASLLRPSASVLEGATPTLSRTVTASCSVLLSRRLYDHPQGLDPVICKQYMKLDIGEKVLATYIWIDGTGQVRERETHTQRWGEKRERGRKKGYTEKGKKEKKDGRV